MAERKEHNNKKSEKSPEEKSIFETIKEVNRREREEIIKQESSQAKKAAQKEAKAKEEYSKKLQQEKLELIKIKQGIIAADESEDKQSKEKHYSIWEKMNSFFYRNKIMVILGAIGVFLVGFLTVDFINKDRPDMTIMVLIDDQEFDLKKEQIGKVFEKYIDDINGNGEIHVTTYYMPLSENLDPYTQQANSTKYIAFMEGGTNMLVMADKEVYERLQPESQLYDLQKDYPDKENVKEYGFYFSKTNFLNDIGYNGDASDEYYIGIRKVSEGARNKGSMQKNFNIAYDALKKFIEEYS